MDIAKVRFSEAAHLLDKGCVKDAYLGYLAVLEISAQELRNVKFVHHTVVSRPMDCEELLATIHSSLYSLEDIIVKRSPDSPRSNLPSARSTPPIPPKPATLQKPRIPPKPTPLQLQPLITENSKPTTHFSPSQPNVPYPIVSIPALSCDTPDPICNETPRIQTDVVTEQESAMEKNDENKEVHDLLTQQMTEDHDELQERRNSLHSPEVELGVDFTFWNTTQWNSSMEMQETAQWTPDNVLRQSVINVSLLVPAQTHTGESLAPPMLSHTDPYVPNIPAPPLLTLHRQLQTKLDELEKSLNECKLWRRHWLHAAVDPPNMANHQLDPDLDNKILQRTASVAGTRETLNKVRTLYMSAMTVPDILHLPPHLIAYQFTLIESAIFRDIPISALLSHSPRSPHPKITASTDFFNYVTRAIEHTILLPQEASRRAEIIHRWIKIAAKCLTLHNYQTLKAIVSALGTPPVQRLRRTWECIPRKRLGRLDLLNLLMSESDNYRRFREHMGLRKSRKWTKPVVPFLGVFIHDMTYLVAAAKGNKEDDPRVQDLLSLFQMFQNAPKYSQQPPSFLMKSARKPIFRTGNITNALPFTNPSTKNPKLHTLTTHGDEDEQVELEQQVITQYLLMRPWVNEKIIDELSLLREPPKSRAGSMPNMTVGTSRSSANGGSGTYSGSLLSNASSLVRFQTNSGYSTTTSMASSDQEPVTPTTPTGDDSRRSSLVFWPFRKSMDLTRTVSFAASDSCDDVRIWSDDNDDEDEDEDGARMLSASHVGLQRRISLHNRRRPILGPPQSAVQKQATGHARSYSLPSAKLAVMVEPYPASER
ncbi:ras guanine nucleotide exchange factor domain-containing protein [Radiomyces spectabilis]|uniref:ras guanine nucleotide exchange factor domain-containing protein n=1 Tax=Radiomyces spectabilis TaxID=64574 RepID=UPI00221E42F4|nr:ras guanine nucleotide exchange factor domain-containing protein [Radiomyces spectabilis]KAI8376442.1 ras guanine nucleotide exchange factor domain-containing protein [Radiomyces spectabilis]